MTHLVTSDNMRPDLGGNFRGGDNTAFTPVLWAIWWTDLRSVLYWMLDAERVTPSPFSIG